MLFCTFAFVGCDNKTPIIDETKPELSVSQPQEGVKLILPQSAEVGEEVLVTAQIDPEYYVLNVLYNGQPCKKVDGGWKFTMLDVNVNVSAEVGKYTLTTADGIATLASSESALNIVVSESVIGRWELKVDLDSTYMTKLLTEVSTSEGSVLPKDAITIYEITKDTSNEIIGCTVVIDTTKLKAGKAWLMLSFESGNNHAAKGTLMLPITVTM